MNKTRYITLRKKILFVVEAPFQNNSNRIGEISRNTLPFFLITVYVLSIYPLVLFLRRSSRIIPNTIFILGTFSM